MINDKPVILLTGGHGTYTGGLQHVLNKNYADAVFAAGGVPILAVDEKLTDEYALLADGLLLTGGVDIEPMRYGEEPVNDTVKCDALRDEMEFPLFEAFVRAGKPVFGICRGFQVINVALGGTLWQDIPSQRQVPHPFASTHTITLTDGSLFTTWFGTKALINSYHHQAVKQPGNGLVITAWSDDIGLPEAFEHESLPIFALQCHPERMTGDMERRLPADGMDSAPIFRYFVELCGKFARR